MDFRWNRERERTGKLSQFRVVLSEVVHIFRCRVSLSFLTGRLAEICCDVTETAAFSLRHLVIGEDDAAHQHYKEDEKDIWSKGFL